MLLVCCPLHQGPSCCWHEVKITVLEVIDIPLFIHSQDLVEISDVMNAVNTGRQRHRLYSHVPIPVHIGGDLLLRARVHVDQRTDVRTRLGGGAVISYMVSLLSLPISI